MLTVVPPAAAQIGGAARRVALVIGNSAYLHTPRLANPGNDAADMAATLRKHGFEVIEGDDLDKAGFDRKVRDFASALKGADAGVFFYAGHGLQVGGQNYLVPIDAKAEEEAALDFEMVRVEVVQRLMERQTESNILFLDACRDNPLARNLARSMGTRSAEVGRGLAQIQAGVGTLISFATQPGNVALDGTGRNSPFTGALVSHLAAPKEDLSGILIDVRRDVMQATRNKQIPWEHVALRDRFYFTAPPAKGSDPAGLTPGQFAGTPQQVSEAVLAWNAVKDSTSIATLEAFREQYAKDNRTYDQLAKERIAHLRAEEERRRLALLQAEDERMRAEADAGRCSERVTMACLRAGVVRGHVLSNLRQTSCAEERVYFPGELNWKSIWTTSVYSYAPGGGGPGGGLANDVLRVGGWGDLYYTLMQFDTPKLSKPVRFAAVLLFAKSDETTPTALHLDRITSNWGWKAGDRLWWKDRPSAAFVASMTQPQAESWYAIEITSILENWRLGLSANYGLQLRPAANNNNYSIFHSTRSPEISKQPRLLVCT
jgi:hypothetical protein